jgi:hypothetical protein
MTMSIAIHDYGDDQGLTREQLTAKYITEVYDTGEMTALFSVQSFSAPFVFVTRKADGIKGSLKFQHSPRYYYKFVPEG